MLCPCLAIALFACTAPPEPSELRGGGREKYALLVGCTTYSDPGIRSLTAPANEVKRWGELLTEPGGFAFPRANVERLVGWPGRLEARPTYQNIVDAFERLVAKAGPGTQIVVLLSGHGTQWPIPADQDPLDPNKPELDGLDEVFLPADVIQAEGMSKGIKDDAIGSWLSRIRDRGASVWIIFDCCHAGMMARGGPGGARDPFRSPRFVDPAGFGARAEDIDQAIERAKAAIDRAEARGENPREMLGSEVRPRAASPGKIVAFYAAQPHEASLQLYRPSGAEHRPENLYGLFSYSILQELETRRGPLSYRDLIQRVVTRYHSSGRSDWPTPFAEGDLDQGVLGLAAWPSRAFGVLQKAGDAIVLDAGELASLTLGSILSVHPPAGSVGDKKATLGHVRVASMSTTSALVVPCAFGRSPLLDPEALPDLARCELVSRDFGDRKLRLFLEGSSALHAGFAGVRGDVKAMAELHPSEEQAQLVFRTVSPGEAEAHYGLRDLEGDRLLLMPSRFDRSDDRWKADGKPRTRKIYGVYAFENSDDITHAIGRDLPRIFRCQDVWRIAKGIDVSNGGDALGLSLEIHESKGREGKHEERPSDMIVEAGQVLQFRLANAGPEDFWVVLLHLDANFGITVKYSGPLGHREALRPSISLGPNEGGSRSGVEGMVVLGILKETTGGAPDFSFLNQPRLRVLELPSTLLPWGAEMPLGELLQGQGVRVKAHSAEPMKSSNPVILVRSWLSVP